MPSLLVSVLHIKLCGEFIGFQYLDSVASAGFSGFVSPSPEVWSGMATHLCPVLSQKGLHGMSFSDKMEAANILLQLENVRCMKTLTKEQLIDYPVLTL